MSKKQQPIKGITALALILWTTGPAAAGSLDATSTPAPTMHTLDEIYQKVQNLVPQTLQTLSAATTAVSAGYYAETNLTQIDTDLAAANIKTNVTIFGIAGTLNPGAGGASSAPVPKTGQTVSQYTYDDGNYRKGVAWPSPRFTSLANANCIRDNLTGLIWAKDASVFTTTTYWTNAIALCEALVYGGESDWRMPNLREMESLVDYNNASPALPTGHPFLNVASDYWTSTTVSGSPANALKWRIKWAWGFFDATGNGTNPNLARAWPVRGP